MTSATTAAGGGVSATERTYTVLVFSDDPRVREGIRAAVGRRPASDLGRIEYVECASGAQVVAELDAGGIDLAILDGEAQPTGGMGICRQAKYEVEPCPPIMVAIARRDDRWLAKWSLADATIAYPVDPIDAAAAVADVLRSGAATGRRS